MKKEIYYILITIFLLDLISILFILELREDDLLKVVFFDIGQGDGIFIETPEKHQIIIDGGPDYNLMSEKISEEIPFWDKEIDLIILTHTDKDHQNGLLGVLEKYDVKNIIWNGVEEEDSKGAENWKAMVEKEIKDGGEVNQMKAGDKINVESTNIEFLWPEALPERNEKIDINDYSLVFKICYYSSCYLFTGDISSVQENYLISKDISADVLKISHHGSKEASTNRFLSIVDSKIAVIQVGENNYGHPSEEVLERLSKNSIKILRNDASQDIEIDSDGKNFKVITHNNR